MPLLNPKNWPNCIRRLGSVGISTDISLKNGSKNQKKRQFLNFSILRF